MLVSIILGIVVILVISLIYIGAFMLNKKTKIPKGCEIEYLEAQGCSLCALNEACSIGNDKNCKEK